MSSVLNRAFKAALAWSRRLAGAWSPEGVGVRGCSFIVSTMVSCIHAYRSGIWSRWFGNTARKSRFSKPRSRMVDREFALSMASCWKRGSLAGVSLTLARLSSGTKGAWRWKRSPEVSFVHAKYTATRPADLAGMIRNRSAREAVASSKLSSCNGSSSNAIVAYCLSSPSTGWVKRRKCELSVALPPLSLSVSKWCLECGIRSKRACVSPSTRQSIDSILDRKSSVCADTSWRPVFTSEKASGAGFFKELKGNSNRVRLPSEGSRSISVGSTMSEISKANFGDQIRGVSV